MPGPQPPLPSWTPRQLDTAYLDLATRLDAAIGRVSTLIKTADVCEIEQEAAAAEEAGKPKAKR
jgi:hypothetical protein